MSSHEHGAGTPRRPGVGDPAVERAWHEASQEEPPARLDAAILQAARDGVDAPAASAARTQARPGRPRQLQHWPRFAAAAAIAGLAFVLVPRTLHTPTTNHREPGAPTAEPARESPADTAAAPAVPAPSRGDAPAPAAPEPPRAPERSPANLADVAPTSPPAGDVEKRPEFGAGAELQRKAQAAGATSAERPADAAAAAAPARERAEVAAQLDAPGWAARIAELHASGNLDAAVRELRSFRAAVPGADAYLSPTVRDWARTVE